MNSADAAAYFHVQHGLLSSSLVGFAFPFKAEVLVIANEVVDFNGPNNMVL